MEKYTYLLLSLLAMAIWFLFFLIKPKLRPVLFQAAIVGALLGPVSELWFFQDYWRPLTLMGIAKISIEDILFGFAVMGVAATIYKVFFNKKSPVAKSYPRLFGAFFIINLFLLLIFNNWLKINSIFVSAASFLMFAITMVAIRKDLLRQSLLSGLLLVLIVIPIYWMLFNWIMPDFWDSYWLLAGTSLGLKILGNIPATELVWYFSLGCFAGIAPDFYQGE